jgi:hypothetical protein
MTDTNYRNLVDEIEPILHGNKPEQIAAALGTLAATLFAGINPDLRDEAIMRWLALIRELIPVEIEIGISGGLFPQSWRGKCQN